MGSSRLNNVNSKGRVSSAEDSPRDGMGERTLMATEVFWWSVGTTVFLLSQLIFLEIKKKKKLSGSHILSKHDLKKNFFF